MVFNRRLFQKLVGGVALVSAGGLGGLGYFGSAAVPFANISKEDKEKLWNDNWDLRKPTSSSSSLNSDAEKGDEGGRRGSTAKRILICVRHGQYNLNGLVDKEKYLTNLGKSQADLTGHRLKDLLSHYYGKDSGGNLSVNVVMSTMTRATQTAQIILKHFPEAIRNEAESCDLIREGAPCEPIPPIDKSIWNPAPHEFHNEGIRIEAAFRKYFHRADPKQENDSVDILVCHGNVIRYFLCRALQFPPEGWLRLSLHNGSITAFTIFPNGRVVVSALGDTGHFPTDKLTLN